MGNTNFAGKDEEWRQAVLSHRKRKADARELHFELVLASVYHFTPAMLAKIKALSASYELAADVAYAAWSKRHGFTVPTDTSRRALKARMNAIVSRAKAAGLIPSRPRYSTRKPRGGS